MSRIRIISRGERLAVLFGASLVALFALLLAAAGPARATFPGSAPGLVAFQSNRDGNFEIYTMYRDGTSQTRITNNPADDEHPKWSPDGKKIVFQSNRDGNLEIYTMNADGTGQTRITNNPAFDELPSWSADGTKIVFDSGRDDPHGEIYTMNTDGTGVTRLTNDPGYDFASAWSPVGDKIAWQSSRTGGQYDIYDMNVNGSSQTRLTTSSATDEWPSWSPSGGSIEYDTNSNGDFDTATVNEDGTVFAPNASPGDQQAVSPPPYQLPGRQTMWTETRSGNTDIYSYLGARTTDPAVDEFADQQPVIINHVRPKGATPLYVPLVPAYTVCSGTNSSHRPSIGGINGCVPPHLESGYLTVGTPDVNGVGAGFIGSVRIATRLAAPEDGTIRVSMTDIRCAGTSGGCSSGALSDYTDDVRFDGAFRITDKGGYAGNTSATTTDLPMNFSVPCASTASTTVGSTCAITTTINTVYGASAVTAGLRAIWQLSGPIRIFDGGADGVSSTTYDNMLFAVGGVFFP